MTSEPRVSAFGTWASPVTPRMLSTAGVSLSEPWIDDGAIYWHELRPAEQGRGVVVRGGASVSPVDATPTGFNVRSRVHEYGGGAWTVHAGTVVFSYDDDGRLYRQDPGRDPVPITPDTDGLHRFADGRITDDGASWIGVRERHASSGRGADVENELVTLPLDGASEPVVIAGGRDFYATPRISPDGASFSWLSWNLPWMPWDGCELWVADRAPDGSLTGERPVAGRDGEESIWQPTWSPAGDLVFASDRSGWWNLERIGDDGRVALHPASAEFGSPQWELGASSFAFLADGRIACWYGDGGVQHLALLDPRTGELLDLDLPYSSFEFGPAIAASGDEIGDHRGGSRSWRRRSSWLDLGSRARGGAARERRDADRSAPSSRCPVRSSSPPTGASRRSRTSTGRPTRAFDAPDDELPPLIVMSHGGPTREATATLRPRDPVLDHPRIRRRRRELRRVHGVRPRVPSRLQRQLGRRRHGRLHQRSAIPRRVRCGRRQAAADPRRKRRRIHDPVRADVPRRLRRGNQLVRHQRSRAVRDGRHAQVRVALRSHAGRTVARGRRPVSSPQPDPLGRSALDADVALAGSRGRGRAAVAVGATSTATRSRSRRWATSSTASIRTPATRPTSSTSPTTRR